MNSAPNHYGIFHRQHAHTTPRFHIVNGIVFRINYARLHAEQLDRLNNLPQSPLLHPVENHVWRERVAPSAPAWPSRIHFNYDYPTPLIKP